jgi:NADP-dependent 3-hydroxy acid dehydrogenase YdfG
MMAALSEQRFLVTGASGGVGSAVVRRLAVSGARLILTGRNRTRLGQVAAGLPGRAHQFFSADLTVESELQELVSYSLAEKQRLDGVIHCAAIIIPNDFAHASVEEFETQFAVNVRAPFRLTQLLLPALTSSQGQVIFINSSAGREASAGVGQYAATKHALRALADSLREECNAAGIRVCSLFLGSTATAMQQAVRSHQDRTYHPEQLIQPDDVAQMVATILALPHTAEVTDFTIRPTAKT